jgi:hypothetical protein
MADSATTSNRLRKQTLASNVNVWGDPYLNANFDLIDAAMDGVLTIAVGTATATTLTSTNYASDQTRNRVHVFTGTGTQTLTATIPFVTKNYLAINDAAGPVRYVMASGTGATVEAGRIAWVVSDGTNMRLGAPRLDQVPSPTTSVTLNSQRITSLATGTASSDAVNKGQVDAQVAALTVSNIGAPTAAVSFNSQRITNLATPTGTSDAVTKAYADGLSFSAALPAGTNGDLIRYNSAWQTLAVGTSGQYLGVSGGLPAWVAAPSPAGDAGTTITTATTLAASSERVRPVAMTTDAQSVTLPNATTLAEGGPLFVFPNTGARTFGVRDSTGTLLAAVPAGGVAECYLRDNSTAAGSWSIGGRDLSPALTICDATLPSTLTQTVEVAVRLTDTLSLHFARNASGHPFVFAVDHSTAPATVGTAVLIVASNDTVADCRRISNTKATVFAGSTFYNITVAGTICTVSAASSGSPSPSIIGNISFTGAPTLAQMGANNDMFIGVIPTAGTHTLQAYDCSGAAPVAGSTTNLVASGGQRVIGIYRVSDTTALAVYIDDSGSAGVPFSLRAVVLSLSGTTITVGTSAGINDTQPVASGGLPVCQLSTTSYVVGYVDNSTSDYAAVHIGVSGTTVTFGTPLIVEVGTFDTNLRAYASMNALRFQPNLFPLTATTALLTYAGPTGASDPVRHVVLSDSGGTLTAGTILYGLWSAANGGNFPQASDGFLASRVTSSEIALFGVGISGTALTVTGSSLPGAALISTNGSSRFGLSGGVRGVAQQYTSSAPGARTFQWNLFRFAANAAPRYLGVVDLPNVGLPQIPVEVAANKVAFITSALATNGSTTATVKIMIVEFAA